MKVILANYDCGDFYEVYTAPNIVKTMRDLWEDVYNDCLAEGKELSEEDSWFEDEQSQIVGIGGEYIAEFKVLETKERI